MADESAAPYVPSPLVGHQKIQQDLKHFITEGKVPNGLLFYGPEGVGKRLAAEHFAWSLICGLGLEDPAMPLAYDLKSPLVPVLNHGAYRGFGVLEKDGNAIKVQQVRELTQKLALADEGWRVIIVDAVNDLNTAAANALLKTLEEPMGQTVLVLICHNLSNVLPTIISRCRKVRFGPLQEEELSDVLKKHIDRPMPDKNNFPFFAGSAGQALRFMHADGQSLLQDVQALLQKKENIPAEGLLKKTPDFSFLGELLLWAIAQESQKLAGDTELASTSYNWGILYQKTQRILADQAEYNLTPQLALEQIFSHIEEMKSV